MAPESKTDEPENPVLQYVTNRWSRHVVQPLLITIMITSLFAVFAVIASLIFSETIWLYMILLCFFMVLEGVATTLWLQRPSQRITDNMAYRSAELVVILLLTRLFTWFIADSFPDWHLYLDYLRKPLILFSDPIFFLGVLFIFAAWVRGIDLTMTFSRLAVDRSEAIYYLTPKRERTEDQRPFPANRAIMVHLFFRQWIFGGVVLTFGAAISTFDLPQLATHSVFSITRLGLQPAVLLALIAYFLSGFLLMSQARLQTASARWLHTDVIPSKRVEKNWHRYSIRILIVVAFLSALLPIGSTTGIGQILESFIALVVGVISLLYVLFITLLSLFIPQSSETDISQLTPTPTPQPTLNIFPPSAPTAPNETAAFIFSSAFWAVAIVLTVIAVSFFLRERGIQLDVSKLKQAWQQIQVWWRQLWQRASQQVAAIGQAVRDRLAIEREEEEGGERKRPFRFIRVNALPPREQIRYFYLSIVRRAAEKGIERQQSETPLEYAQELKEELPDAEIDVETLTDAFLKARYSPQPIEKGEINPIKRRWKQLRSTLRRRRKQD